ncbi:MAG TPA: UbiD family decarboxylase [Candidatus Dormibacteraeota bacterium]|nr:UbiD family decarboxylase [Candidatus Dormibacteraeota bacterium]
MLETRSRGGREVSAGAPKSLGAYLDRIRHDPAEFRTVSRRIVPQSFEVTAVLEHLHLRKEFPTVFFENPLDVHGNPSRFPLVSNLWATRERCADMLEIPRTKAGRELGPLYAELVDQKREPIIVSEAPVQANVLRGDDADMHLLPVVRHFEMDLGPVLTMALAMREPDETFYNITFVKTFPETGRRGGLTIHSAHMSRMTRAWERRGRPFPVINILGHHPAFWLGSMASTPWGDNEYATVGGFLREPLRLVPSVTWGKDFLVPADAEIVIEGEIDAVERTIVDPFGEISRQYQPQELAPVMHVKAITYRDGAIMQDIFSGHPEHMLLGSIPREGSLMRHLRQTVGDNVTAVHVPLSGVGRFVAYISLKKTSEGQPKLAALQAIAQAANLQTVVVVDDDIDVFNEEDVLWAVNTYVDPARDVDLIKNLRPPSDPRGLGSSRLLIDATRPTHKAFPTRLRVPPEVMARIKLEEWLDPVGQEGR